MASVRDVIQDELAQASIELSEVSLDSLLVNAGLGDGTDLYEAIYEQPVRQAVLTRLERILVSPDINEGGFSMKYDRAAVAIYCARLRTDLGLPDADTQPVRNRSRIW